MSLSNKGTYVIASLSVMAATFTLLYLVRLFWGLAAVIAIVVLVVSISLVLVEAT